MPKWIFLLLFSLSAASTLPAQELFTARVSSQQVQVGETFRVEFVMKKRGSAFQPPDFSGFQRLSGRNVSMSTTMDASGTHFTLTYSYLLEGQRPGTFTIGAATATIAGETYRTEPLKIEVVPRSKPLPSGGNTEQTEEVLLRPLVSDQTVYVGEPLYARYRLYFRNQIGQPQVSQDPAFDGFYRQTIEQDRIPTKTERYRGRRYTAGDLRRMILIPQRPGTLNPGTLEIKVPVRVPTGQRDWFGRPIVRTRQQTLRESFPPITVKPLPTENQPASFTGGVGQFSFEARLSRQKLSTNESLTLSLKVKGQGNVSLLGLPKPTFPEAFEVFDPETDQHVQVGAYGMRGSRSAQYLLVPRYSGTYKLGPIRFSYFDPETGRYRTISSPQFTIEITGNKAAPTAFDSTASGASAPTGERQQVNYLLKTLRYIQTELPEWQPRYRRLLSSPAYWLVYGGLWLIALALLGIYLYRRKTLQPDKQNQRRQRRAARQAQKHLARARKKLRAGAHEAFYEALAEALWGYFSQKFDIPLSQFTKDRLRRELERAGLPERLAGEALRQLESAEMARYTGLAQMDPEQDYESSRRILTKIERAL